MILEGAPKIQHDVSEQNIYRHGLKMQGTDGWWSAPMANAWWPSKTAARQGRFRGCKPWDLRSQMAKPQAGEMLRVYLLASLWHVQARSCWSYEAEILDQGNLSCAISSDHFWGGLSPVRLAFFSCNVPLRKKRCEPPFWGAMFSGPPKAFFLEIECLKVGIHQLNLKVPIK